MSNIENYDNKNKLDEVLHFSEVSGLQLKNIFFLKSLNENEKYLILPKLKKLLSSKWNFRLALLKNDLPYNFDKLDREGVVGCFESYYQIYLVTDIEKNSYFITIKKINFFLMEIM